MFVAVLLGVSIPTVYLIIGGITAGFIKNRETQTYDHPAPWFGGVFWPLVVPVWCSARGTERLLEREPKKPELPEAKVVRR